MTTISSFSLLLRHPLRSSKSMGLRSILQLICQHHNSVSLNGVFTTFGLFQFHFSQRTAGDHVNFNYESLSLSVVNVQFNPSVIQQ